MAVGVEREPNFRHWILVGRGRFRQHSVLHESCGDLGEGEAKWESAVVAGAFVAFDETTELISTR